MKLYCHPISPYARKAMILARLHEIDVEEIQPEKNGDQGYGAGDNPLGKIPALEWQPNQYLFDSPVVCEYLDSLGTSPVLPTDAHRHMLNKWQHALGDGLADAVYKRSVMLFKHSIKYVTGLAGHGAMGISLLSRHWIMQATAQAILIGVLYLQSWRHGMQDL